MPAAELYHIDSVRALRGRPRVTYPFGGLAYKRTERVWSCPIGQAPKTPGVDVDPDHPGCVLTEQAFLGSDTQYDEYFQIFETMPGPVIEIVGYDDENLNPEKTGTQKVLLPATVTPLSTVADGDGWIVVDSYVRMNDTITGELVTISVKLPTNYTESIDRSYQFPAKFYFLPAGLAGWTYDNDYRAQPPYPGVHYDLIASRSSSFPATVYHTFHLQALQPAPSEVWNVYSPGAASKAFPIPNNCVHGTITLYETPGGGGSSLLVEYLPESDPLDYTGPTETDPGEALIIGSSVQRWKGNIWRKRNVVVQEGPFTDPHTDFPDYPSTLGSTP